MGATEKKGGGTERTKNYLADCLCQKRAKGPYLEKSFSFFLFPPSALHLPTLAVAEFRGRRRRDSRAQTLLTPSPLASLYCLASSLIFQRHLHRSSSSTSTSVAATAARTERWLAVVVRAEEERKNCSPFSPQKMCILIF